MQKVFKYQPAENVIMNNIPDIKQLLFSPREFFNSIYDDEDYLRPWLTIVIPSLIYYFVAHLLTISRDVILSPAAGLFGVIGAVFGLIFFVPSVLAAPFVGAGIIHLGAMILGVRDSFIKTFKVVCYGGIVGLIYNLISQILSLPLPFIAMNLGESLSSMLIVFSPFLILIIIATIHQFYVQIQGLSLYYNVSKLRAFFSIILIPAILLFLVASIVFLIIGLIYGFSATGNFVSELPNMLPFDI